MTKRSIQRRILKARISLNHTIQKILDINRNRKKLEYSKQAEAREQHLNEELRVLNKMAEYQDRLIKYYERTLTLKKVRQNTTERNTSQYQQPTLP
ncbi:MAG: hypothetical protein RIC19_20745 [Phaeodactylibacter sp.]|uniref:hypothetical protein n=1 Tax=Phaeodactylibacter sp. TaxID=1940289 RepID=UPI0032EBC266